jgi:hypothetical protein
MADVADIVEAIKIGPAAIVDQPDAFAAHEFDRFVIGDRQVRQQQLPAALDDFFMRPAFLLVKLRRDTGERAGIGEQFRPDIEIALLADAENFGGGKAGVGGNLQVKMRRPAAVFVRRAHLPDKSSRVQAVTGLQFIERLMRKMTPERNKGRTAFGFVAKRDQAAVSEGGLLDLDADDGRGKRRINLGAGGHEEVETKMPSAADIIDQLGREHLAGIDRARLAPGADAQIDAMFAAILLPCRLRLVRLLPGGFYRHRVRGVTVGHQIGRIGRRRFFE